MDDSTVLESILSVLNLLHVPTRRLVQCESCLLHLKTQWRYNSAIQATSNSKYGELQHPRSLRCKIQNCNHNPIWKHLTSVASQEQPCDNTFWLLTILNRHANYHSLKDQFAFKTSTSISFYIFGM